MLGSRGSRLLTLALMTLPLTGVSQPIPARAAGCNVWFIGSIYDAARRFDFIKDVDNFELFLTTLRATWCIPSSQAKILAFDDDFTRNGKTYEEASEANLKNTIASFGQRAAEASDAVLFLFHSSHGIAYATANCAGGTRSPGSMASLKGGGGQDGTLRDCELGNALNTSFPAATRMFVSVDCSLCGGFSDSLTAASGTIPDNRIPVSSGLPAPERIVATGCAITTECFGGSNGSLFYGALAAVLREPVSFCDGMTAPEFPGVQGFDVPIRAAPPDGRCSASEWFFAAVQAVLLRDAVAMQQQFRIKYGPSSLAEDLPIA